MVRDFKNAVEIGECKLASGDRLLPTRDHSYYRAIEKQKLLSVGVPRAAQVPKACNEAPGL